MREPATTRCRVIWRHVDLAIRYRADLTHEAFGQVVVDHYHARTPLHLRAVKFHALEAGGDVYRVQRTNAQLLFRMLDPEGPTRLCVELEEAVVLSLPEPHRGECLRELSNRYGLLAAPRPADNAQGCAVQLGGFSGAFGDCITQLAVTIGDGWLEPSDADHADEVITALDKLAALTITLRSAHAQLLKNQAGALR